MRIPKLNSRIADLVPYCVSFTFMSMHSRTAGWINQEDATQGGPELRTAFGSPLPFLETHWRHADSGQWEPILT